VVAPPAPVAVTAPGAVHGALLLSTPQQDQCSRVMMCTG
jgi:hypothetical protein